jgi:hypothetical protein
MTAESLFRTFATSKQCDEPLKSELIECMTMVLSWPRSPLQIFCRAASYPGSYRRFVPIYRDGVQRVDSQSLMGIPSQK